ncbi:MAG: hemerythrin domain-containing protein [Polyangiaceae bacterium]|nr:hemerythrin domain-containing protein [Polyangiaceae bacterium]
MDALDLLEQQHREVTELLDRLAVEASGEENDATIEAVLRAVEAHVRIEEAYVYVACASKLRGDGRAEVAGEQRAGILSALRLLGETSPSDPQFRDHVATLSERFAQHADAEEDAVFPKLKRTLTDEALDVLGEALERAHHRFLFEDKPFFEMEPVSSTRPSARSLRARARRSSAIVRSGVRAKIRPTSL